MASIEKIMKYFVNIIEYINVFIYVTDWKLNSVSIFHANIWLYKYFLWLHL